ncbi:MAG TPA: DUF1080 domain-containing protein [Candidatus Hydrogenedens sp.]|nr:DUF1080 domain-containing protein [Candidatus Hydrogenedens sp.]HOK08523.1 DUF1080 domain-containing protein [Candidatus Hydrogenedens sp.]HOL19011.1 DUF1080 domain-containing protein [Candidatus Hydrogenedens sp.]HPP57807.1 DUF1080 domain-containing protein [Candidatus Hydrogenedens sp.]
MSKKKNSLLVLLIFILGFFVGLDFDDFVGWILKKPIPIGELTKPPEGEGWIDLLSSENRLFWKNVTDEKDIFEIQEDGTIHIFGRTLYPLRYVGYVGQSFSNFQLHLEFKLTKNANSGVFLRSQPNDPLYRGFEVQVLEDYGKPPNKNSCGAIYDITTPMYNMSFPPGQWNSYDIVVDGQEVQVSMNGWLIIHTYLDKMTTPLGKFPVAYATLPKEGYLLLQDHGGEVWYRNIKIKPLP